MVFHYTNFMWETNAWWIRRVRPVWAFTLLSGIGFVYYRYKMMGKLMVMREDYLGKEKNMELAALNKRFVQKAMGLSEPLRAQA